MIDIASHYVKFENYPDDDISMMVTGETDGNCIYKLEGFNQDSNSSLVCTEGVTTTINIAKELGVKPYKANGRTVNVLSPSGVSIPTVVDNFSMIKIANVIFGTYTIDTTPILPNTKITLSVGG